MTSLQIDYRSPQALADHPRNAREHSARQINQLKASISSFGFNVPVIIDETGMILAGHGRVRAAIELSLPEIPTVTLSHMSPKAARAFMLADNQIGTLSSWDSVILADELQELALADEAFEITDTGFELQRIDVLIEERHKPTVEEDAADAPVDPANVEAVSRLGDLWLLGPHRLFVGNALDPLSYHVLLGQERAQMVFIDAPYNVPIKGHVSGLGKVQHREFVMGTGEMSDEAFQSFLRKAFENLIAFSIDGSIHFSCMDWRSLKIMLIAGEIYSELKNICCWVKSASGMGSLYRSQHEVVAVFKAGTAPHINNIELGKHGRNRSNVWMMPGMSGFQKGRAEKLAMHPTVKPVALIADTTRDSAGLSRHSEIAKAFAYGAERWRAFNRFLYNGLLEPDNLIAERAIRGFTVGRRNWLFSGSFAGAERSARILSIIATCQMNGVDPEAYMADVMQRIAEDWPASRWGELMPWNWAPAGEAAIPMAA